MTLLQRSSRREIIEMIRREQSLTRRGIAERTGLSRSLVAQTVSELIAEGLVTELRLTAGRPNSSRGRPTAVLRPAAHGWAAAIDVGHRHVALAIVRLDGRIAAERRAAVDVDAGAASALRTVDAMVAAALAELGLRTRDLLAVTIGVPFPVDGRRGLVHAPDRLPGWAEVVPTAHLPSLAGVPAIVDNDANLGAWGEYVQGAGREVENLLYVKAGDGIGAGLVVDGVVFHGARGVGGEMGHVQVDPAGPMCRCGRYGCLEAVASATAIRGRTAGTHDGEGELRVDLVDETLLVDAGESIGIVLAQLCNFLAPDAVVVGGSLSAAGEPLLRGMRSSMRRFGQVAAVRDVPITASTLGVRAELAGAVDRAIDAAWTRLGRPAD